MRMTHLALKVGHVALLAVGMAVHELAITGGFYFSHSEVGRSSYYFKYDKPLQLSLPYRDLLAKLQFFHSCVFKGSRQKKSFFSGPVTKALPPPLELSAHIFWDFFLKLLFS